ncbi:hypothetical protein Ppb6_04147 [Photorhabdus australis subsp. thailandensis]|uniref:Uncharacterized protein n=1 Tax=Photorhabdus australis subsp. thailandensis TaxID=2805096 RepID=A0A1C0TYC0_9GAMM|nr:hypothetical protein Ppb6_04147 [Photorhabdus australis subsp. thailandensis]
MKILKITLLLLFLSFIYWAFGDTFFNWLFPFSIFAQKLVRFKQRLNLRVEQYQADHISLRCHDISVAKLWRKGFLQCSEWKNIYKLKVEILNR